MDKNHINIKNKLDEGHTFKVSRFKEQIKKTKPHKHDEYYELIFLHEGEGFHTVESEKYMVSTPEFYFLKPGQLHFWQFTSIPKGFVIMFKDAEFNTIKENELIELYRKLLNTTRIKLQSDCYPEYILNEIYNEFIHTTKYSNEIIHGLLIALFGKILQKIEYTHTKLSGLKSTYDKFQILLLNECPKLRRVNEYASILNVTPQNLNTICRITVAKSASEIITLRILLEAKRYILHTDYTINEIADILSFSDTSNFIKFFKKTEGLTPVQFREQYFQ